MAKKRPSRDTLSRKRDPRVDSEPPPATPRPTAPLPTRRPSARARQAAAPSSSSSSSSSTSAERREIRASSPTPPDRRSLRPHASAVRAEAPRPPDDPPRLAPEVVITNRPGALSRTSLLEQELSKERIERAAEADLMAEMLVRVTSLEARARSAEAALASAEREADTKVRASKEQGAGLARKIEDAEGRVAELESELRSLRAKSTEMETRAKRATVLEEQLATLGRASEERNLELLDRVSSLQAELSSAQRLFGELGGKHDALQSTHASLSDRFTDTTERLSLAESDLSVSASKLAAATDLTSAVEARLGAAEQMRKELEERLGSTDAKVRAVAADKAKIEQAHAALTERHADLAAKKSTVERELEATRTEAQARVAAIEARLEDTRKVLEQKLEDLRRALATAETQQAETRAALLETTKERDRLGAAMTPLSQRVATLESLESKLLQQLSAASQAFARAAQSFDEIDSRETAHALRRARDLAGLKEALRPTFSAASFRGRSKPPYDATPVVDVTDHAVLLAESMRPHDGSAPSVSDSELDAEDWDDPSRDDEPSR